MHADEALHSLKDILTVHDDPFKDVQVAGVNCQGMAGMEATQATPSCVGCRGWAQWSETMVAELVSSQVGCPLSRRP